MFNVQIKFTRNERPAVTVERYGYRHTRTATLTSLARLQRLVDATKRSRLIRNSAGTIVHTYICSL